MKSRLFFFFLGSGNLRVQCSLPTNARIESEAFVLSQIWFLVESAMKKSVGSYNMAIWERLMKVVS